MRLPLVHEEMQRRRAQRRLWLVLGLLAFVAAPATLDAGPWAQAPRAAEAVCSRTLGERCEQITDREPTAPRGQRGQQRYWRGLAPLIDTAARRRLSAHAAARPARSARDAWLVRFVRPPTL